MSREQRKTVALPVILLLQLPLLLWHLVDEALTGRLPRTLLTFAGSNSTLAAAPLLSTAPVTAPLLSQTSSRSVTIAIASSSVAVVLFTLFGRRRAAEMALAEKERELEKVRRECDKALSKKQRELDSAKQQGVRALVQKERELERVKVEGEKALERELERVKEEGEKAWERELEKVKEEGKRALGKKERELARIEKEGSKAVSQREAELAKLREAGEKALHLKDRELENLRQQGERAEAQLQQLNQQLKQVADHQQQQHSPFELHRALSLDLTHFLQHLPLPPKPIVPKDFASGHFHLNVALHQEHLQQQFQAPPAKWEPIKLVANESLLLHSKPPVAAAAPLTATEQKGPLPADAMCKQLSVQLLQFELKQEEQQRQLWQQQQIDMNTQLSEQAEQLQQLQQLERAAANAIQAIRQEQTVTEEAELDDDHIELADDLDDLLDDEILDQLDQLQAAEVNLGQHSDRTIIWDQPNPNSQR